MRTYLALCGFWWLNEGYLAPGASVTVPKKISVLVPDPEARRFEAFCNDRGHKKSTLIVRLIKEHMDREQYPFQESLLPPVSRKIRTQQVQKKTAITETQK
ncbi:hypothetical protein VRY85_06030 [Achromobacter sp. F4_2707]|uniref:hypothetical protein n=1 Tax=Achromobacter sp. F4_2707 TaxID=3114286 RepID=UPI0039C65A55